MCSSDLQFSNCSGVESTHRVYPCFSGSMIRMRRPARSQNQIYIQQPAHGQSPRSRLMFSGVISGAPGGASRSKSSPAGTSRAWRQDGADGRSRAVRKRTNSACCSEGSASAAASISIRVLTRKLYHRCLPGARGPRDDTTGPRTRDLGRKQKAESRKQK